MGTGGGGTGSCMTGPDSDGSSGIVVQCAMFAIGRCS